MSQPEQSVEEILASIKRIIVDEEPGVAPVRLAPAGDDDVLELTTPLPPLPPAALSQPTPDVPMMSSAAAAASRQSLASLAGLKLSGGDPADDTLAGLVRELLRPLLKDWLDAHLPAVVERAVVQEIARLQATRG